MGLLLPGHPLVIASWEVTRGKATSPGGQGGCVRAPQAELHPRAAWQCPRARAPQPGEASAWLTHTPAPTPLGWYGNEGN